MIATTKFVSPASGYQVTRSFNTNVASGQIVPGSMILAPVHANNFWKQGAQAPTGRQHSQGLQTEQVRWDGPFGPGGRKRTNSGTNWLGVRDSSSVIVNRMNG